MQTVDHLVSNAAIVKLSMFEDVNQISEFAPTMVRFFPALALLNIKKMVVYGSFRFWPLFSI